MSRHGAATTAGRRSTVARTVAPPLPRRVSGPAAPPRRVSGPAAPRRRDDGRPAGTPRARIDASALAYSDGAVAGRYAALPAPRARALPSLWPRGLAYGGVAIATRVADVALDVSASRLMDRVVRGRVWIGVIALFLIGLVAMQVSLLKLNAGIGRAAQTVSTLDRRNAALRSDITSRSAGDRIQLLAEADGLVMPAPADIRYLTAGDRRADAERAAALMRAPDASRVGFAAMAPPLAPEVGAGAAAPGSDTSAPATSAPVVPTPTPTPAPAPPAATSAPATTP